MAVCCATDDDKQLGVVANLVRRFFFFFFFFDFNFRSARKLLQESWSLLIISRLSLLRSSDVNEDESSSGLKSESLLVDSDMF